MSTTGGVPRRHICFTWMQAPMPHMEAPKPHKDANVHLREAPAEAHKNAMKSNIWQVYLELMIKYPLK